MEGVHFAVRLGTAQVGFLNIGLPVIGGEPSDDLVNSGLPVRRAGLFSFGETPRWLFGGAVVPVSNDLEEVTHRVYNEIFAAKQHRHLVRIWNYVPAINESVPGQLENYRLFCRGRSLAFEEHFGPEYRRTVPAASAVGCQTGNLSVVFASCSEPPAHVENPLQVPAYEYPPEYGPRPPSFARATVISEQGGTRVFVSGTAAVRGHVTVAPGNTRDQLACTLENLRAISQSCGLGPDFLAGAAAKRYFKVYLRYPSDYPEVSGALDGHFFRSGDNVSYLHANICRQQLNVEIEATIMAGSRPGA